MNRIILRYGTAVTIVILAVFAWVLLLAVTAVVVWMVGSFTFIALWPRITVGGFKRVFVRRGLGGGPIPVNTIYAVPLSPSQSAEAATVIATGTDDILYFGGWLDVTSGPRVLHVPAMRGRYYSVQFTDPISGANFAYVGTRTTGSDEGDFLLCGPRWQGVAPDGMTRIDIPHRAALLIGRVFVADDGDRPAAYALAQRVGLSALAHERAA